ncbi:hypothetical protein U1Q18_024637 [Sarracenia purpurea var. burkii]
MKSENSLNCRQPARMAGDQLIRRLPFPRDNPKIVVVLFHSFHQELPNERSRTGLLLLGRFVHDVVNYFEEPVPLRCLETLVQI